MAKAGYAKAVNTNSARLEELKSNFALGSSVTLKTGKSITVAGYWGDRCIVGGDGTIYNVESDFDFKFSYNQLLKK